MVKYGWLIIEPLVNLKINLGNVPEDLAAKALYGKVVESGKEDAKSHLLRFTSVSPEIASYFLAHQQHAQALKKR